MKYLFNLSRYVLLFSLSGIAQAEQPKNIKCKDTQFSSQWRTTESNLSVLIDAQFDQKLDACVRHFRVIEGTQRKKSDIIYSEMMAESPVAVWPLGERLLTLWESGSAFWISIYGFDKKKLKKILDARGKSIPEITFLREGEERIIFVNYEKRIDSTSQDEKYLPVSADAYTWTGKNYRVVENVPWEKRFDEVLETSSTSSK